MEYTVLLGDRKLQGQSEHALIVPVVKVIIHDDYDSRSLRHDIALLQLAFAVNYTAYIQPVCIPEKSFNIPKVIQCWITGWGQQEEEGETAYWGAAVGCLGDLGSLAAPGWLEEVACEQVGSRTDAARSPMQPAGPGAWVLGVVGSLLRGSWLEGDGLWALRGAPLQNLPVSVR